MGWTANWYVLVLFAGGVVNASLAAVTWQNRQRRAALPACGLFVAMAGWALADAVRVGFPTFGAQFFWYRVAITAAGAVATTWFLFALVYAGYEDWLSRRVVALLSVKPVVYVLLAWTNPAHGLVWTDVSLLRNAVPPNLAFEFGTVYVVHIAYAYALTSAGVLLLFAAARRSTALYRRPVALAVGAVVPPFAANVAFSLGVTPSTAIDFTPVAFALTGTIFAVALFEYDLLNRVPIARAQLLDALGGGLVVTTTGGRVVHRDEVGATVAPAATVGSDAATALGVDAVPDADGTERRAAGDDGERWYDVEVSRLSDFRDRHVGYLIAFRDVTERRASQQRLEVTNRLLRHNLRNASTKLMGWGDRIATRTGDDAVARTAAKIEREAADLADLSDEARHIEDSVGASDTEPVALDEVLAGAVTDVREQRPEATITLSAPADLRVTALGRRSLEVAFRNVVENGVVHDDGDAPRVEVRATRDGDRAVVEVSDDGPGLPPVERATLRSGTETPLQHSQGLGLWLTHWAVDAAGGEIRVADATDGTTIVITLPLAGTR